MLEALDLSTLELALAALAAVAGAVVQGAIGFGYALVVVPLLRPAVLAFAGAAGTFALLRGLL